MRFGRTQCEPGQSASEQQKRLWPAHVAGPPHWAMPPRVQHVWGALHATSLATELPAWQWSVAPSQ
jgi:hypothetical protein